MANLYEINQELIDTIEYEVDVESGECLEGYDLDSKINEIQMTLSDKIDNIACYIKNLESDVEAFKVEKQKLEQRQRVARNRAESLKKYLNGFIRLQNTDMETGELDMEKLGKFKFETPRCKLSYRKSVGVEITDLNKVPSEYIKPFIPTESDVKKTELKELLKSGDTEFAKLVENKNLQIK